MKTSNDDAQRKLEELIAAFTVEDRRMSAEFDERALHRAAVALAEFVCEQHRKDKFAEMTANAAPVRFMSKRPTS